MSAFRKTVTSKEREREREREAEHLLRIVFPVWWSSVQLEQFPGRQAEPEEAIRPRGREESRRRTRQLRTGEGLLVRVPVRYVRSPSVQNRSTQGGSGE